MVCWSLSYVVKFYCCDGSMEDCGVSNAELSVVIILVHMNRLSVCSGMHSWQLEWHKM